MLQSSKQKQATDGCNNGEFRDNNIKFYFYSDSGVQLRKKCAHTACKKCSKMSLVQKYGIKEREKRFKR
jgi:hypothetical protein